MTLSRSGLELKIFATDNADSAALNDDAVGSYVYTILPESQSQILVPSIVAVTTLALILSGKKSP